MTLPVDRPRVVFDCNAYVQAMAYEEGPAAEALRLAESGAFELIHSRLILRELRRVVRYKAVRAISPNMTPSRITRIIERIQYRGRLVRRVPHVFDLPRDRKDEPYVDLAIAVNADFLVTRDNDLLSLMSGHDPVSKRFRQKTHPLRVVDPASFLQALMNR